MVGREGCGIGSRSLEGACLVGLACSLLAGDGNAGRVVGLEAVPELL